MPSSVCWLQWLHSQPLFLAGAFNGAVRLEQLRLSSLIAVDQQLWLCDVRMNKPVLSFEGHVNRFSMLRGCTNADETLLFCGELSNLGIELILFLLTQAGRMRKCAAGVCAQLTCCSRRI